MSTIASDPIRGGWTEGEKSKILWSLIDIQNIDWKKCHIPEGRTRNAVSKMLKREHAKVQQEIEKYEAVKGGTPVDEDVNDGADTATSGATAKAVKKTGGRAKGSMSKKKKGADEDDEDDDDGHGVVVDDFGAKNSGETEAGAGTPIPIPGKKRSRASGSKNKPIVKPEPQEDEDADDAKVTTGERIATPKKQARSQKPKPSQTASEHNSNEIKNFNSVTGTPKTPKTPATEKRKRTPGKKAASAQVSLEALSMGGGDSGVATLSDEIGMGGGVEDLGDDGDEFGDMDMGESPTKKVKMQTAEPVADEDMYGGGMASKAVNVVDMLASEIM